MASNLWPHAHTVVLNGPEASALQQYERDALANADPQVGPVLSKIGHRLNLQHDRTAASFAFPLSILY